MGRYATQRVGGTGARPQRGSAVRTASLVLVVVVALIGCAGVAAAGLPAGGDGPIALLGTTLDTRGCTTAPKAVGDGVEVCCPTFGAVTVGSTVRVITLFAEGDGRAIGAFGGTLPEGLEWGCTIAEAADVLGPPQRITDIYGPPTLVYMFNGRPYGSLELLFDTNDRLVQINASLTR